MIFEHFHCHIYEADVYFVKGGIRQVIYVTEWPVSCLLLSWLILTGLVSQSVWAYLFFKSCKLLLLLLRSQSHAQTSSPVLTRKSAVRRRDAVGPQSFSFRSTGYGQVSCLRVLCDGQDWRMCSGVWESVPHGHSSVWASLSL